VLFVQDILAELAPGGTCAMVLDEGLLFRTNESAFVETKRKLVDECDLWAIVSLPGGVFSTAGAGVKTNLLFFTRKGGDRAHLVLRPVACEGGQEDAADTGALWLCSKRDAIGRCGPSRLLGGRVAG
jgi:hypothetical protein